MGVIKKGAFFSCCKRGARAARWARSAPEGWREAPAQRRWVPRSGAKRRRRRLSGGRATRRVFLLSIFRLLSKNGKCWLTKVSEFDLFCSRGHIKGLYGTTMTFNGCATAGKCEENRHQRASSGRSNLRLASTPGEQNAMLNPQRAHFLVSFEHLVAP